LFRSDRLDVQQTLAPCAGRLAVQEKALDPALRGRRRHLTPLAERALPRRARRFAACTAFDAANAPAPDRMVARHQKSPSVGRVPPILAARDSLQSTVNSDGFARS